MCMFGDFIKECIWNHFILAPIRSFFGKDKVKEEVQQGVEVVVNVAEKGLQQIDEATSGAVSSIADELSKAGVDLGQFKNSIVEKLEHDVATISDDVHTLENEVSNAEKKVVAGVTNISQGIKDEVQNVETQTEVKVAKVEEAAKTVFVKSVDTTLEKVGNVGSAIKKTEESAVETVSSLTSDLLSFGGSSGDKKETPTEEKKVEDTNSGIQNAKEAPLGFGERILGEISDGVQSLEDSASKTGATLSSWTTSLLPHENKAETASKDLKNEPEKVETSVKDNKSSAVDELKETQSLGSTQDTPSIGTTSNEPTKEDEHKKESTEKKKERSGLSSGLRFLRDTVVSSKEIVMDTLNFGRHNEEDSAEKSAPEFQSTQLSLSSSTDTKEKPTPTKESPLDNTTTKPENTEIEMGDQESKKETSPIKEVSDFLSQEISDSSKHIEAKGVNEAESTSSKTVVTPKHTLFDSITDFSSTIANTLHNIETGIESTGKNILTGVGAGVKEAGHIVAGTEDNEEFERMDDKDLKTEAVTSLLDKSFIN